MIRYSSLLLIVAVALLIPASVEREAVSGALAVDGSGSRASTTGPVGHQFQAPAARSSASMPARCAECHHSDQVSQVVQLTSSPSADLRPAWNPDSTRLAYYSGRSGNDDIWAVNIDGTNEQQITHDPASDRRPAWSPDGSRIVFDSDRGGSRDIWVANADGSDPQQLTNSPGEELFASWSPDGSEIVFFGYTQGHNEIWAMSADGTSLRSLTDNLADEQQGQCTFACHQPSWSPDGASLAFHADQDGKRDIWIMDADGRNRRQLTSGAVNNSLPSFTSDGQIIFVSEIASLSKTLVDIKMVNPDSGEEKVLFQQVAHGGPFVWSPDGNRVALHSQRGAAGNFDIFVATLGDAPPIQVPAAAEQEAAPDQLVPEPSAENIDAPATGAREPAEAGQAASPALARVPVRLAGVVAVVAALLCLFAIVAGAVVFFVVRSRG